MANKKLAESPHISTPVTLSTGPIVCHTCLRRRSLAPTEESLPPKKCADRRSRLPGAHWRMHFRSCDCAIFLRILGGLPNQAGMSRLSAPTLRYDASRNGISTVTVVPRPGPLSNPNSARRLHYREHLRHEIQPTVEFQFLSWRFVCRLLATDSVSLAIRGVLVRRGHARYDTSIWPDHRQILTERWRVDNRERPHSALGL